MPKYSYSKKYKHVFSYKNKSGIFWGYRFPYYDSLGKRREASKTGIESERKAYKSLLSIQFELETKNTSFIENKNMTVNEWIKIWIPFAGDHWSNTTRNSVLTTIRLKISPLLGNKKLSGITKISYKRDFLDKLRLEKKKDGTPKYTEQSILTYHKIFMRMVNSAVDNQIIQNNVLRGFSFEWDTKVKSFTKKELKKFMETLSSKDIRQQTIFIILLKTGMRKGELMGLRWEDINTEEKYFDINSTRGDYGENAPKTKASRRKIYFDSNLLSLIHTYKLYEKTNLLKDGRTISDTDFFLLTIFGKPMYQSEITRMFRKICHEADVPNITVHGLRHTHATFLIESGANIKYVSSQLGHNQINITLDIYSDVLKEKQIDTAEMMDKLLNEL